MVKRPLPGLLRRLRRLLMMILHLMMMTLRMRKNRGGWSVTVTDITAGAGNEHGEPVKYTTSGGNVGYKRGSKYVKIDEARKIR